MPACECVVSVSPARHFFEPMRVHFVLHGLRFCVLSLSVEQCLTVQRQLPKDLGLRGIGRKNNPSLLVGMYEVQM